MIDYFIAGIAAAGIEMIYQRLMFIDNPLHWWFTILKHWRYNDGKYPLRAQLAKVLGYCHLCNSVWLSFAFHILLFKIDINMLLTAGVCFIVLCTIYQTKGLIHTEFSIKQ